MAVLAYSDEAVGESGGCGYGGEEVGSFPRGGAFEEVAQHDQSPCQGYRRQSPLAHLLVFGGGDHAFDDRQDLRFFLVEVLVESLRDLSSSAVSAVLVGALGASCHAVNDVAACSSSTARP